MDEIRTRPRVNGCIRMSRPGGPGRSGVQLAKLEAEKQSLKVELSVVTQAVLLSAGLAVTLKNGRRAMADRT